MARKQYSDEDCLRILLDVEIAAGRFRKFGLVVAWQHTRSHRSFFAGIE